MSDVTPDLKAIFLEALEQDTPQELAEFLDEQCDGNADLRGRVDELLRAHQKAGDFLGGESRLGETVDSPGVYEIVGSRIGPYAIREKIGEGGMGTVYVAEQERPMRRKVALKIIKPGMDTREVVARFEAERQALALMDHPNIAKVHDGGTTSTGRPYFVMELVKGISIVEYCDQQKLSTVNRLELCMTVCQAVQHAHSKGVIHRDLKPSNILIAPHDGRPVVKVIDFGVAKAIGQKLTDKTLYTRFSQMIGTPLYMSPEQAELNALDVDTRSDIYSIGVLIYELLTGTTPFKKERFATAAFDEIRRIIREEDPPKPSTRITTLKATLPLISRNRDTEPSKLSAIVKGDLDWIVMQCLEKDRSRRYETANGLAADIRRFLAQQPIEARPPSALYRFGKFTRRNRSLIATGSGVALTMIVATIASLMFASSAIEQRGIAENQKEIAETKGNEARLAEEEGQDLREVIQRQVYNLTMSLAFLALGDGDLDRLRSLLSSKGVFDTAEDAKNSFEYRFLDEQHRRHRPAFEKRFESTIRCVTFSNEGFLLIGSSSPALDVYNSHDWTVSRPLQIADEFAEQWETTTVIRRVADRDTILIGGQIAGGLGALAVADSLDTDARIVLEFDSPVADISTNGNLVVIATQAGSVVAWDLDSRKTRWKATVAEDIEGVNGNWWSRTLTVATATNGDLVAAAVKGTRELRLFDAGTGRPRTPRPFEHVVRAISFSPDGTEIAVATRIGIHVHRVIEGELHDLKRLPFRIHEFAYSPTENEIAAADAFGGIRILDPASATQIDRVIGQTGVTTVRSIQFSPDGEQFAAFDAFGILKVWRNEDLRPLTEYGSPHRTAFQFFSVSPTSHQICCWGPSRRSLRLWDTANDSTKEFGDHSGFLGSAFSSDGTKLAAGGEGGKVFVWDASDLSLPKYELQTDLGKVWAVAFAPNNLGEIAIAGKSGVLIWNFRTDEQSSLDGYSSDETYISIDYSPDGRYLVAGGGRWNYYQSSDQGRILLWDREQNTSEPSRIAAHKLMVYTVDFHPDGQRFAAAGLDSSIKIYSVDGRDDVELQDKSRWITGLAFTPDGKRLVTASAQQITFWDPDSRDQLGTFRVNEQVRRIGFLADGSGMVTASTEGFVRLWKATPPVN